MRHKTRPIITVQPYGERSFTRPATAAMIRLRGKWVANLFPPYTRLMATLEMRRGELVLVLEPIPEPEPPPVTLSKGGETLTVA